jgi:hypothetical protein
MTDLDALLDRIEDQQKVEGQIQLSTHATSLDFLQAIYRDSNQPIQRRMRAAMAALPFEKPKLMAVAQFGKEDLVEALERARRAHEKVIELRATQVIEAKQVEAEQVDEVPDHSAPFAHNTKHRFKRI